MDKGSKNKFTILAVLVAFFFLFFLGMESVAFARAGGGRSSGSRGFSSGGSSGGTYRSAPSQPSGTYQQRPQAAPAPMQPAPQAPSFGRSLLYGIGGGLLGGAIGSMLFGGRSFAGGGGWGGGGGFGFGDFIIILLVLGIVYYMVKRFRARKQEQEMQMSTAGAYGQSYGYSEPARQPLYEPAPAFQGDGVSQGLRYIRDMDPSFDENRFREIAEDNFFKIQSAWTKRDLSGVRGLLSPQMLNTFENDVNNYRANKQYNRLENIAVRQVEIVDAAQDQGEEYITVKLLASLLDYTVDETTNQVISGSSTDPVKFLEYWTFQRKVGERNWVLGGITQERDY